MSSTMSKSHRPADPAVREQQMREADEATARSQREREEEWVRIAREPDERAARVQASQLALVDAIEKFLSAVDSMGYQLETDRHRAMHHACRDVDVRRGVADKSRQSPTQVKLNSIFPVGFSHISTATFSEDK